MTFKKRHYAFFHTSKSEYKACEKKAFTLKT